MASVLDMINNLRKRNTALFIHRPVGWMTMITGNYIISGHFANPRFAFEGNRADVTMTFTKLGWRLRHYVALRREAGRWWIERLDWETN